MAIGLVGQKSGMTRIFTDGGTSIPVTVIEVLPNRVTQIKTKSTDGYDAIQVTTGTCKPTRLTKALKGHYAKANVDAGRGLWEFRLDVNELKEVNSEDSAEGDGGQDGTQLRIGAEITVSRFNVGQKVDVTGTSKGKGFAGTVKRHNFATQDATHGNSLSHRAPGSIGQNQSPGRVFKGKKMSGHLGDHRTTVSLLEIVKIDVERNLLMVKGAVPGAINSNVIVRPAAKAKKEATKK